MPNHEQQPANKDIGVGSSLDPLGQAREGSNFWGDVHPVALKILRLLLEPKPKPPPQMKEGKSG